MHPLLFTAFNDELEKIALSPELKERARAEALRRVDRLDRSSWGKEQQMFSPKELAKTDAKLRRYAQADVFAGKLAPGKGLPDSMFPERGNIARVSAKKAKAAERSIGIQHRKTTLADRGWDIPKKEKTFKPDARLSEYAAPKGPSKAVPKAKAKPKAPPPKKAPLAKVVSGKSGGSAKGMIKRLLTGRNLAAAGLTAGGIYLGAKGHKAMFGKKD